MDWLIDWMTWRLLFDWLIDWLLIFAFILVRYIIMFWWYLFYYSLFLHKKVYDHHFFSLHWMLLGLRGPHDLVSGRDAGNLPHIHWGVWSVLQRYFYCSKIKFPLIILSIGNVFSMFAGRCSCLVETGQRPDAGLHGGLIDHQSKQLERFSFNFRRVKLHLKSGNSFPTLLFSFLFSSPVSSNKAQTLLVIRRLLSFRWGSVEARLLLIGWRGTVKSA